MILKHGKNPTRAQMDRIESHGLDPEDWFVTKDCSECFEIVNRETDEVRRLGA